MPAARGVVAAPTGKQGSDAAWQGRCVGPSAARGEGLTLGVARQVKVLQQLDGLLRKQAPAPLKAPAVIWQGWPPVRPGVRKRVQRGCEKLLVSGCDAGVGAGAGQDFPWAPARAMSRLRAQSPAAPVNPLHKTPAPGAAIAPALAAALLVDGED